VAVTRAALLVAAGLVGFSVFGWLVWPPLVLLPGSVFALVVGLLMDVEAPGGESAAAPHGR
jgi:hypothetical protein